MEAGLDSLGATELQASLGAAFGLQLPATATIDHPTSAALAAYIGALLGDTPASQRALPSSVPCSLPIKSPEHNTSALGHGHVYRIPSLTCGRERSACV
jgi:hypothetical protein